MLLGLAKHFIGSSVVFFCLKKNKLPLSWRNVTNLDQS